MLSRNVGQIPCSGSMLTVMVRCCPEVGLAHGSSNFLHDLHSQWKFYMSFAIKDSKLN